MNENKHIKNAKVLSGVNIVAGLWLIISPFILGFTHSVGAMYNSMILGLAIGIAGLVRQAYPEKSAWASWLNIVLGAWLFLSAFFLSTASSAAVWNGIILGIVIMVMAASSVSATHSLHQHPTGSN